ncbi:MAG: Tm-1-like ATP-binding domain-containing protein [Rhodobacteraceae bacterium]|jgi:uncharacterized protein (UPF0261 family)|nr:Tm-1-like ATP-binding domain-containing protein [Paracoccaceae bacterium]
MSKTKTILIVGTYDTKAEELAFVEQVIRDQGGKAISMDVSVLGEPGHPPTHSRHEVAAAAGTDIAAVAASGDENTAMAIMARGAAALALRLHARGAFDGMIALGGTMGTDLALDVALALPLGVPKYIVSTVAFSAVIAPERLPGDVQMILWAGGLYGLNAFCASTLAQAAGAVLGAARATRRPAPARPLVGITSLGNACLRYIRILKPELEARGYEVAIFHSTGMGGRAFEALAGRRGMVAALDLCLQEFNNGLFGSIINSGTTRLESAGAAGVPQIVAPGAADLVDWPTWAPLPESFKDRPVHVHNKLISSLTINAEERIFVAREIAARLNLATAPVHMMMPLGGVEAWDRPGEVGHAPGDLAAFYAALRESLSPRVARTELDCHINAPEFAAAVLRIFDEWVALGIVPPAQSEPARVPA